MLNQGYWGIDECLLMALFVVRAIATYTAISGSADLVLTS